MRVTDWMTLDPVTIAPDATAGEALALMRQRRIRHLPVVDGGRLVGMLSDRDVRTALPSAVVLGELEEDDPAASRPVAEIMTADPLTIPPSQPVEEAARLLTEQRIGAVPVVEGARLLGILSADDLLRAFVESSGVLLPSSRLELLLPDRPGALAGALAVVAARRRLLTLLFGLFDHLFRFRRRLLRLLAPLWLVNGQSAHRKHAEHQRRS